MTETLAHATWHGLCTLFPEQKDHGGHTQWGAGEFMSYYERLLVTAERIARHAPFPGKQDAMDLCLVDLEDLLITGKITVEQRDALREVLLPYVDAQPGCPSARRERTGSVKSERVATYV